MLRRLSSRELLASLAAEWERALADAWLAAIADITSSVALRNVVERLERCDVHGAVALLDLNVDRFPRIENAVLDAYNAGGAAVVSAMPRLTDPQGNRVHFSWGVRNLPAEQALRRHAASLVDGLVGEQLGMARQVLAEGLARGQNPRQTALRLVGRINRLTGLREGGLIGLTPAQTQTVAWIEQGLAAGDADGLRQYLGLRLRDKRFDRTIIRAQRDGEPIPTETVARIVRQYSNRALKYRGEVIALAETNTALAMAKNEAFQQQLDAGKLDAADLTKTWVRTVSRVPRHDHLELVGQTVAFDQPFIASDGTRIMYPHAPDLPAKHRIGCKCGVTETIDFTAQALRRYRARTGG